MARDVPACLGHGALGSSKFRNASIKYTPSPSCTACIAMNKRSQWGEDRRLLPEMAAATSGFARPGTFVELGALDGVWLSNTHLYEKCFGWSGVLIEASNVNFDKLVRSGRTNSAFVHSAICSGEPRNISFSHSGKGQTSHQVSNFKLGSELMKTAQHVRNVQHVPCRSMEAILASNGYNHSTLLSLDVEGAELEVLSTVEPKMFDVIMVEWGSDETQNAGVAERLSGAGMRLLRQWQVASNAKGGRSRVYGSPSFVRAWEHFALQTFGSVPVSGRRHSFAAY